MITLIADQQLDFFGDEYERLRLKEYGIGFDVFLENPLPIIQSFDGGNLRPLLTKQKEAATHCNLFGWDKVEIFPVSGSMEVAA